MPSQQTSNTNLRFVGSLISWISTKLRRAKPLQPPCVGRPLVILVHGTFASDAHRPGEKWWHANGDVTQRVTRALEENGIVDAEFESFTWRADNALADREHGARDLVSRLSELEVERRPYHLVAHSHGGSVLWSALVELWSRGYDASALRSWATVGTPFVQLRPSAFGPRLWAFLVGSALFGGLAFARHADLVQAYALLKNALGSWAWAYGGLAVMAGASVLGIVGCWYLRSAVRQQSQSMPARLAWIFMQLLLPGAVAASIAATSPVAYGTVLLLSPNFDHETAEELIEFAFAGVPWALGAMGIIACFVVMMNNIGDHTARIWSAARQRNAWNAFATRHLALSATDDEAINLLSIMTGPTPRLVPRANHVGLHPIRAIVNWTIAPLVDQFLWDHLHRKALGLSGERRFGAAVETTPLPQPAPGPSLLDTVEAGLLAIANQSISDSLPAARAAIRLASDNARRYAPIASDVVLPLRDTGAVHCGYFDSDAIIELLARHISTHREDLGRDSGCAQDSRAVDTPPRLRPIERARSLAWTSLFVLLFCWSAVALDRYVGQRDDQAVLSALLQTPVIAAAAHSDGPNLPVTQAWLSAAIDAGHDDAAMSAARAVRDPARRALALCQVSRARGAPFNRTLSDSAVDEALKLRPLPLGDNANAATACLIGSLLELGRAAVARSLVDAEPTGTARRAKFDTAFAISLAEQQQSEEAIEVARSISDPPSRAEVIAAGASARLSQRGLLLNPKWQESIDQFNGLLDRAQTEQEHDLALAKIISALTAAAGRNIPDLSDASNGADFVRQALRLSKEIREPKLSLAASAGTLTEAARRLPREEVVEAIDSVNLRFKDLGSPEDLAPGVALANVMSGRAEARLSFSRQFDRWHVPPSTSELFDAIARFRTVPDASAAFFDDLATLETSGTDGWVDRAIDIVRHLPPDGHSLIARARADHFPATSAILLTRISDFCQNPARRVLREDAERFTAAIDDDQTRRQVETFLASRWAAEGRITRAEKICARCSSLQRAEVEAAMFQFEASEKSPQLFGAPQNASPSDLCLISQ